MPDYFAREYTAACRVASFLLTTSDPLIKLSFGIIIHALIWADHRTERLPAINEPIIMKWKHVRNDSLASSKTRAVLFWDWEARSFAEYQGSRGRRGHVF